MNEELQALYEEDQADRRAFEQLDREQPQQVLQRDRARRQRVEELVESEALQAPEDYFHAAMVFQHGETLEDFWRAHELAKRGAELGNEPYRLWDVDPSTTDEERAAWDVPPLAEALRQAEELTQRREQAKQGMPQEQGPQRLASFEVPGLRVEIVAFDEQFVHQVPDQERPSREELPAPDTFPAGWKLYRLGEGYCATTPDGQEAINWYKVQQPLSYAWREQEVPQFEAIQLGHQPAILIRCSNPSFTQLFLQLGDAYYVVDGQVALNELLQLATSIPWTEQFSLDH